jgi:predicted transcriptional regulator
VSPEDTALDAFRKMTEYETGRLIVTDPAEPKKIVGIITKSDLMHTMIEQS